MLYPNYVGTTIVRKRADCSSSSVFYFVYKYMAKNTYTHSAHTPISISINNIRTIFQHASCVLVACVLLMR